MDVLDGNLEAIEAASLTRLHLIAEVGCQVLIDNAVTGSEEGQNVTDFLSVIYEALLPILNESSSMRTSSLALIAVSMFELYFFYCVNTVRDIKFKMLYYIVKNSNLDIPYI